MREISSDEAAALGARAFARLSIDPRGRPTMLEQVTSLADADVAFQRGGVVRDELGKWFLDDAEFDVAVYLRGAFVGTIDFEDGVAREAKVWRKCSNEQRKRFVDVLRDSGLSRLAEEFERPARLHPKRVRGPARRR